MRPDVTPEQFEAIKWFYDEVMRQGDQNMATTGRVEGAHYAAMRSVFAKLEKAKKRAEEECDIEAMTQEVS